MEHVVYKQMVKSDFLLASHFLKQHKQATAGKNDHLFAALLEQKVIAAVWLTQPEDNQLLWMRSLFVETKYRHQGIASKLLHQIQNLPGLGDFVCFAKPELQNFYLQNGFEIIDHADLPKWLQQKYTLYQSHQSLMIFSNG